MEAVTGTEMLYDLDEVADEELVERYRGGQELAMDVLLTRYRGFTRTKARPYFLAGGDKDDIVQEGMIGLYKAIRDYDPGRQASFKTFADVCITRQILTAVKAASRQKHSPLNSYVSLSTPTESEEGHLRALPEILGTPQISDPAELLISSEDLEGLNLAFAEVLSDFEAEVLHLFVEGKTYREIARIVGKQEKAVDNALQRVKRKVEIHLGSRAKPQSRSA